jgi:DDE superfamily endonuclease
LRISRGLVARGAFPPHEVAQVKAIACELPKTHGVPLSRFSRSELHRFVVEQAISEASASTIGRWLARDAIKPSQQRSPIFPRDLKFLERAARSSTSTRAAGKASCSSPATAWSAPTPSPRSRRANGSIRARRPAPGRGRRVEHEYERKGTITYLDAWDVRRGRVMGRSEPKSGIAAFDRLVWQVMTKEPYASAPRVFWIVHNGSDHRGQKSIDRIQGRWPNLVLVHTPVHGSPLNQVEIYHSIIQRKVLAPNDFDDTAAVARALNDCEHHYNQIAKPFEWNFTRDKLAALIDRRRRAVTTARRLIPTDLTARST